MPSEPEVASTPVVMSRAPTNVITEPMFGTPGNTFTPPVLQASATPPRIPQETSPHSPSSNQRSPQERLMSADALKEPDTLPLPPSKPTTTPVSFPVQDWAGQIEQLRNDVFGIAMSVSALGDRLDRLESRVAHGGQSASEGVASLRTEIEAWLEHRLNGAVEQCFSRIVGCNAEVSPHSSEQRFQPNQPLPS